MRNFTRMPARTSHDSVVTWRREWPIHTFTAS